MILFCLSYERTTLDTVGNVWNSRPRALRVNPPAWKWPLCIRMEAMFNFPRPVANTSMARFLWKLMDYRWGGKVGENTLPILRNRHIWWWNAQGKTAFPRRSCHVMWLAGRVKLAGGPGGCTGNGTLHSEHVACMMNMFMWKEISQWKWV